MSRMQLMLDSASYNQELRQARQTLQAHGLPQPLPPGRLVGARPSGWYSEMGSSPLDGRLAPAAPLASSNQSFDFRENHPSSFHEILSPRASTPPARPISSWSTEQPQASSSPQPQPWDLSQPPSTRLPAFMPAMVSLLETLAPYKVPDSNFDSILNR